MEKKERDRIANVTVPQLAMKNDTFALAVKNNLPVPCDFPALRRRSGNFQTDTELAVEHS